VEAVSDTYIIFPSGATTNRNPSNAYKYIKFQILSQNCFQYIPIGNFYKFQLQAQLSLTGLTHTCKYSLKIGFESTAHPSYNYAEVLQDIILHIRFWASVKALEENLGKIRNLFTCLAHEHHLVPARPEISIFHQTFAEDLGNRGPEYMNVDFNKLQNDNSSSHTFWTQEDETKKIGWMGMRFSAYHIHPCTHCVFVSVPLNRVLMSQAP